MKCFQAFLFFAFAFLPIVSAVPAITTTVVNSTYVNTFEKRDAKTLAYLFSLAAIAAKTNDSPHPREQFTRGIVNKIFNTNPHYNYVICHGPHTYAFDGKRGVDYDNRVLLYHGRQTLEFNLVIGGSGELHRHGYEGGGDSYWDYSGTVTFVDDQNVKFKKPV